MAFHWKQIYSFSQWFAWLLCLVHVEEVFPSITRRILRPVLLQRTSERDRYKRKGKMASLFIGNWDDYAIICWNDVYKKCYHSFGSKKCTFSFSIQTLSLNLSIWFYTLPYIILYICMFVVVYIQNSINMLLLAHYCYYYTHTRAHTHTHTHTHAHTRAHIHIHARTVAYRRYVAVLYCDILNNPDAF